jgi:hypothetical protein
MLGKQAYERQSSFFPAAADSSSELTREDLIRRLQQREQHSRRRLLDQSEPLLSVAQVAQRIHETDEAVRRMVRQGQLVAILDDSEEALQFPAWQFADASPLPGLGEVLEALDADSPFTMLMFFTSPMPEVDHLTPIDALHRGRIASTVAAARRLWAHEAR